MRVWKVAGRQATGYCGNGHKTVLRRLTDSERKKGSAVLKDTNGAWTDTDIKPKGVARAQAKDSLNATRKDNADAQKRNTIAALCPPPPAATQRGGFLCPDAFPADCKKNADNGTRTHA